MSFGLREAFFLVVHVEFHDGGIACHSLSVVMEVEGANEVTVSEEVEGEGEVRVGNEGEEEGSSELA